MCLGFWFQHPHLLPPSSRPLQSNSFLFTNGETEAQRGVATCQRAQLPSGRDSAGTQGSGLLAQWCLHRAPCFPGGALGPGNGDRGQPASADFRSCALHADTHWEPGPAAPFTVVQLLAARAGARVFPALLPVSFPFCLELLYLLREKQSFLPQEPMTSRGDPTTSCGGHRPRSSRRPTHPWGIGATRTCSELCSLLCRPPVCPSRRLTSGHWPHPSPSPPTGTVFFPGPRPPPLTPAGLYSGLSHPLESGARLWFETMLGRNRDHYPLTC